MDGSLEPEVLRLLRRVAVEYGTPCYVYILDEVHARIATIDRAFGRRFRVSYAVKCNSNLGLLRRLKSHVGLVDVSSSGEIEGVLDAGFAPDEITFSGPGKREFELLRAVELERISTVCESLSEIERLDRLALARRANVPFIVRVNPLRVPPKFGAQMGGRASQFGIDEEEVDAVLERIATWKNLEFRGFHIYSGSNSLDAGAIAENVGIFIDIFIRLSVRHQLKPRTLIFGSGFGIPYNSDQAALDLDRLATMINPQIDSMRECPNLRSAECILEMGRFLLGPCGYLLTSVIAQKESRGTKIRICDAGMNNHLAACGLMGMVIRRNFPIWKVTESNDDTAVAEYTLVGPLCTTIDLLAQQITLPPLQVGDAIAVGAAGAYAAACSPFQFISHPKPKEYLAAKESGRDYSIHDVSSVEEP